MIDPAFTKGSAAEKKMMNPNPEHDERMIVETAFPLISPTMDLKEEIAEWGYRSDIHLDPEYQKKTLEQKKGADERESRRRMKNYENLRAQIVVD